MSNIGEFHHAEETTDNKSRTMVAIIIAIAIAAFGTYVYKSGMWDPQPHQPVDDGRLPH